MSQNRVRHAAAVGFQRHSTLAVLCSVIALGCNAGLCARAQDIQTVAPTLPDAPSASLARRDSPEPPLQAVSSDTFLTTAEGNEGDAQEAAGRSSRLPICDLPEHTNSPEANASERSAVSLGAPCRRENPIQPILSSRKSEPLTPKQKGELAFRDLVDPFNLLTIAAYSGFAVSANSHSAYGPGFAGWGRLSGYSFVEDAQGEFFGTFLISSLAHEDPRYHRMPNASVKRRLLHAIGHTYVSQHDDGSSMPNYATLLTYPISAELSNLYVPGVSTNLHHTAERVGIGLATDPSGTLVAEFLPDLAKRIHVRVIFIQEILNQVITGGTAPNVQ